MLFAFPFVRTGYPHGRRLGGCTARVLIRLHPIYMITGDPHALLRATRAVYTPRGGRYTRPGYETTVVA